MTTQKNKTSKMISKTFQIKDLKFAEYNPRKITKQEMEKLKISIEEFGMVGPIVINKDLTIIGGHQRVKACKELGIKTLPTVLVDLPKPKEKALNLALNKISGSFDEMLLAELLAEIEEQHKYTGFEDKEMKIQEFNAPLLNSWQQFH